MRTLSPVKGALVAAACAMALLPAGAAQAGDSTAGPAADSGASPMNVQDSDDNPYGEAAERARVCNDAYQIGKTGYIVRKGQRIGSVKQFYSPRCNRNYGYLYVWKSFRQKHRYYSTNIAVYDFNTKKLVGLRVWNRTSQASFWSYPANTVRHCTAARGVIRAPGDVKQNFAYSSKRC
ncbi:hypothetical protein ACH4LN_18865 [Streptomyces albus]|uniref:Uncharacterized protein n=1 Tax=Streptomyces albus TaxID=1888 RepID=A0A6C1C280_9ACTN|nr:MULTISPECIES: hypothetical protein [Streptomyces]KPC87474.1 hypothetical protein ADL27_44055 [Streptomyces sp. NRRL F-6602]MDI6407956.1 hypothetical protein [Streptomyces albus]QID36231.1 hypothetical protein G3260_002363 [Streptomyces albus]TGG83307.1 hypothetical protein D8771_14840 [Streptomyces albus]UVN56940.1 hypothetical protein NR995_22295 [Streptomyces albus]